MIAISRFNVDWPFAGTSEMEGVCDLSIIESVPPVTRARQYTD
jgi:hypothetical protein